MDIVIDLTGLQEAASNPLTLAWFVLSNGGWVLFLAALLYGGGRAFLFSRQEKFLRSINYILLAIDIPKGNEQTPKAVESIFAHLHGIQRGGNLVDRYFKGYIQPPISLEIIGIEGETQFLIRTPEEYRDLAEAAFYAQYPDAAITEVLDYTESFPNNFQEAGYDLWGAEMVLYNKNPFPIKTYPFFEHSLSQQFLDPLASLLEIMSRLGPTEQVWLQLVVSPADSAWRKEGEAQVKKALGGAPPPRFLATSPGRLATGVYETVTATLLPPLPAGTTVTKKEGKKFSELTPGERNTIEAIQMKASKLGWYTKFRVVYVAKKELMNKGRGVSGILGALKQYNTQDLNGFKPSATQKTSADYYFVKRRVAAKQHRILAHFKKRQLRRGGRPFILNNEEVASIFHFPVETVKAPLLQRTEARRGKPPVRLPIEVEQVGSEPTAGVAPTTSEVASPREQPPVNLPT